MHESTLLRTATLRCIALLTSSAFCGQYHNDTIKTDSVWLLTDAECSAVKHLITSTADYEVIMIIYFITHGKSPCDTLGGILKSTASRYMKSRKGIIRDAESLHSFAETNLVIDEPHRKRRFVYIPAEAIEEERSSFNLNLMTVQGTRKILSVKKGSKNNILVRQNSCFCAPCQQDSSDLCENKDIVGEWRETHVRIKGEKVQRRAKMIQSAGENSQNPQSAKSHLQSLVHSRRYVQLNLISGLDLPEIKVKDDLTVVSLKTMVDGQAFSLLPDDTPLAKSVFPIPVMADGNCLPCVGSILAFGTQDRHLDMRLRIAVEMIKHRELYLDEEHLTKGNDSNLTKTMIAHFSDTYMGQSLTDDEVCSIYEAEINQILEPCAYKGMWQLFALASVLKRCIFSVYPNKGNPNIRRDLNRLFIPRENTDVLKPPCFIMWSTVREDMTFEHWVPNHFVLLLPLSEPLAIHDVTHDHVSLLVFLCLLQI